MFDNLSQRLSRVVKQLRGEARLTDANIQDALREVRLAFLQVDDARLDPVWKRCGELGLPVSIHVADPKAFWLPYDASNERRKELKDHPSWWFGDTNKYPPWKELLEALNRVIARHPKTTFVSVHFANNAEELEWVDAALRRHPNLMADLAARIPEVGRHDPKQVRQLFLKHQDRILFATDFQVDDRLILGSSGNEPPPSDADAEVFFAKHWRWVACAAWCCASPASTVPAACRSTACGVASRSSARRTPVPAIASTSTTS